MGKKYKDALKLAFDVMRSVYANTTNNREMGAPLGAMQFSFPKRGGGMVTKTLNTNMKKVAFANELILRSLSKPVTSRGWNGDTVNIQAFTGASSLPAIDMGQAWSATVDARDYDMNYRPIFKMVTLKPGTLDFSIAVGQSGAKMVKIAEGGRVDVAGFTGEKIVITCEKYGLAFGLTWEMMEGNDFNAFKDAFMNYEAELYGTTADVHYAVLRECADTSGNTHITYQAGTDTLEKDIATINAASTALFEQLKGKSFGDSVNSPLFLLCDIALRERMNRAMKSVNNAFDNAQVSGNITPLYTLNENIRYASASAGDAPLEPILILPQRQLQDAVHTSNLELSETDIRSLSKVTAGWTAFGVGAGEVLQTKRMYMHT